MFAKLEVETRRKAEMIDLTREVQLQLERSGVKSGICVVWVPHTTAGITVNENADPSVRRDVLAALAALVPADGEYQHSEGNSDGHIKSTLCGHGETLMVEGGALVLGTWQGIYLCEFDGPRRRNVMVKVLSDR
jgi:secondary thiamine-phosphate synthase enzyme